MNKKDEFLDFPDPPPSERLDFVKRYGGEIKDGDMTWNFPGETWNDLDYKEFKLMESIELDLRYLKKDLESLKKEINLKHRLFKNKMEMIESSRRMAKSRMKMESIHLKDD